VRLLEITRGREKEEENDSVNNVQIHCICVGRRHNERNKAVERYRVREKGTKEY
jgi:hypothetical protein